MTLVADFFKVPRPQIVQHLAIHQSHLTPARQQAPSVLMLANTQSVKTRTPQAINTGKP